MHHSHKLRRQLAVLVAALAFTALVAAAPAQAQDDPLARLADRLAADHESLLALRAGSAFERATLDMALDSEPPAAVPLWISDPWRDDLQSRRRTLELQLARAELGFSNDLTTLIRLILPFSEGAVQELRQQWQALPADRLRIVLAGLALHGVGYRFGAAGPNSYDCSGFTLVVLRTVGISVSHKASYQQSALPARRGEWLPGDLLFFAGGSTASGPLNIGHVGFYLGAGLMVHANASSNSVSVDPIIDSHVATADPFGN